MNRTVDWLWLGVAILMGDIIVRHTLGGSWIVHDGAFIIGGAAVMWGLTQLIKER